MHYVKTKKPRDNKIYLINPAMFSCGSRFCIEG